MSRPDDTDPRGLDRPAPVRPGEELDSRKLEEFLAKELAELSGSLAVEQFPSGFSNLTYLLRAGDSQWVLRRPPFGADIKTAHDMEREYRILSRLVRLYPKVPTPLLYCDDTAVLGAPFYLMECLEGVILRATSPAETAPSADTMAGIARSFVDTLVELHAVDYRAAGLGDLGKPRGYVRRQIEGWTERYREARTDELPALERAAAWLAEHRPAEAGAALIHNDFKYDNLILHPEELTRVVAVLDWEMATLGDPLMDLGTSLGYWVDPDDPPSLRALRLSPTTLPGNLTRRELVETYARSSGLQLDDVVFYYVYGLFKVAVIIQQIYSRYCRGDTQDPRFASLIDGVRVCGRVADQAIRRQRIDRLFD